MNKVLLASVFFVLGIFLYTHIPLSCASMTQPEAVPKKQVRVGVSVIIRNSKGQILLGKRKGSHGAGKWAPPGGHLEFGEIPLECAIREIKEETGMNLFNVKQIITTNDIFKAEDKHYVTIFFEAQSNEEPKLLEPNKCEEWRWFDWNEIPCSDELFLPFKTFLDTQMNGQI